MDPQGKSTPSYFLNIRSTSVKLRITTRPACGLKPQASSPSHKKANPSLRGLAPAGASRGYLSQFPSPFHHQIPQKKRFFYKNLLKPIKTTTNPSKSGYFLT
jgi:hypothetical protein